MKVKFRKIIFALIIFSFLWLFALRVSLAVDSTLPAQPTPQSISYEEFSSLKSEVEKLRSENYQRVLESSQKTIDKINQYTDRLTLLATVFGFFLTGFGIFFGINFYFAKKEFTEQLKEIKAYVASARQNAKLVKGFADEAKRQTESLPQTIKDFQKNRKEMVQLLAKAKKTKARKVKEFDEALTRIQEKESKLSQKLLQTMSNIQSASSQASAISGSAILPSSYVGTARGTSSYPGSLLDEYGIEPKKCSKCGKEMSPLDSLLAYPYELETGENICSECKRKESPKPTK